MNKMNGKNTETIFWVISLQYVNFFLRVRVLWM